MDFQETKRFVKEIVKAIENFSKIFGSTGSSMNAMETAASPLNILGQRLPRGKYSTVLIAGYTLHTAIAQVQRQLQIDVNTKVVIPLNDWLQKDYKLWKKNVKLLEKARLDMDAAASAVKAKQTNDKSEKSDKPNKLDMTQKHYDEVLESVEKHLEQLTNTHEHLVDHVNTLLIIINNYCKSSLQNIDNTLKQLND
jgi:hypothetical protein